MHRLQGKQTSQHLDQAPKFVRHVFENDKHQVKSLVDIFSGRVVDEATVNVHNSLQMGTSQWLE